MYNIFNTPNKWSKPVYNDDDVVDFLMGKYEKSKYGGELKGIRSFEMGWDSRDVSIIFAKDYRKKGPIYHDEGGYDPFLWSKQFEFGKIFQYNVVEVDSKNINSTHVKINGMVRKLDGIHNRVVEVRDESGKRKHIVRYRVRENEWEALLAKKIHMYGIRKTKLIQSFKKDVTDRMAKGFSYRINIDAVEGKPKKSDHPFFQGYRDKLNGSFNSLLNFFKEGGINPRGSLYFNEQKFKKWFYKASENIEDISRHYIHMSRFIKLFNPFTKDSCDWSAIIRLFKRLKKGIAWKIDKKWINDEIYKNPKLFFDTIVENCDDLTEIFNIQLDQHKINKYLVHSYAFDGVWGGKNMMGYLKDKQFDWWDDKGKSIFFVTPQEQYMIQTGRRLFKGIENYEDLNILVVDIETKALPNHMDNPKAALYPESAWVFEIGLGDNKGYDETIHASSPKDEQKIIEAAYKKIAEYDPDVVLTYNGESFDYYMLEKRLEYLGCVKEEYKGKMSSAAYIRDLVAPYYEEYGEIPNYKLYKRNETSMLKVGGNTEEVSQTTMFGKNFCDVMFAVKRAAAIDKTLPNFKLKDNIKHADLAAKNRVYIDGDKIGLLEESKVDYYLNDLNGKWFSVKKEIEFTSKEYKESEIKEGEHGYFYGDLETLYLYLDDGTENSTSIISECTNAHGLKIHQAGHIFSDAMFEIAKDKIDSNFKDFYFKMLSHENVVCHFDAVGQNKLKKNNSTEVWHYYKRHLDGIRYNLTDIERLNEKLTQLGHEFPEEDVWGRHMKKVKGSYLVKRYLEEDIKEPYLLDQLYSQSTFAISKWLPTKYEKIATMGNANVWKLTLAAWSYLNCIAIPEYEEDKDFTGGLLGMVSAGFHKNIVKIDYSSLYPAEFLQHCEDPDIDITGIYKMLVRYGLYTRLEYKKLMNEAKANGDYAKAQYYDKNQLPLKILINSFYGMLGAAAVSPFAHINSAWHITCSGRQHMRHLIHYFEPLGFKIIYFHTDGANFVIPDNVDDYTYVGKGLNWKSNKGQLYKGVEAYVTEYNDLFMRGKMAVDIDEYAISCINFSKGNFSYLKEKKGKLVISHVGGTLDKKDQNEFISEFYDKHLKTLFLGKANEFVDEYYNFIIKIYNLDILAGKIANRARITRDMETYDKGVSIGKPMQAKMELIKKDKLDYKVGDWIYYINNANDDKERDDMEKLENNLGNFKFNSKAECENAIKSLELYNDNREGLIDLISIKEADGKFYFRNGRKYIDEYTEKGNQKFKNYNKKVDIFKINEVQDIEFKYEYNDSKKAKKEGYAHTVCVKLVDRILNIIHVPKTHLNAKIPYNPYKFINKFNKSISNVWVVFHPEIRDMIPSPQKGREPNERAYFEKGGNELELVSGFPIETKKGVESKQQNLDELMLVTEDEMDFWKVAGMSPNNPFDYASVDLEKKYYIYQNKYIYEEGGKTIVEPSKNHRNRGLLNPILTKGDVNFNSDALRLDLETSNYGDLGVDPSLCEEIIGLDLLNWLSSKVIMDFKNPPYLFIDQKHKMYEKFQIE